MVQKLGDKFTFMGVSYDFENKSNLFALGNLKMQILKKTVVTRDLEYYLFQKIRFSLKK